MHWLLGASFDAKKLQLTRKPVVLGVTYNLEDGVLELKDSRRSELISERQYARFPLTDQFVLDQALKESLKQWLKLVDSGPPRTIDLCLSKKTDVALFTDGFSPDPREDDRRPDRIGAVMFDRRVNAPVQFTARVPESLKSRWLTRKTQIIPVEMLAPIVSLETFSSRLFRADLFIFIDSEVVEAALVKGYSSREDLCLLVSVFWDLVLRLQARVFIDRVATDAIQQMRLHGITWS